MSLPNIMLERTVANNAEQTVVIISVQTGVTYAAQANRNDVKVLCLLPSLIGWSGVGVCYGLHQSEGNGARET